MLLPQSNVRWESKLTASAFTYYTRLGIAAHATPEEIRRAFRALARRYHPDVATDKRHAEELFKHFHEAYSTLIDADLRRAYDAKLRAPPPLPKRKAQAKATVVSAPKPFGKKTTHRRDLDIESELEISLSDAIHGATYVITLDQHDTAARRQTVHSCRIETPPGVYEMQRLRLRGLGHTDRPRLAVGDLYLTIRYAREENFRFIGGHLLTDLVLTPWEAALGGRVRLPTLDGLADLHIPPGIQPGQHLRLRGYGLPQKNGKRGDLSVTIKLHVPPVLSEKERQLWRAIANQHR